MRRGHFACAFIFLAIPLAGWAAPTPWHLEKAPVRFEVEVARGPSHPGCGLIVHLPDGGLLPAPHPFPKAVTAAGEPLDAAVLWHNTHRGMELVVANPAKGTKRFFIYLAASNNLPRWTPNHPLKPSALLCIQPGARTLLEAKQLGKMGALPTAAHIQIKAGINQAPLSIGGDDTGRPQPASFYQLAHLNVTDPGKVWFAPMTQAGTTEVHVNGVPLVLAKRIDKWGGTGTYVDLPAGLTRIETFQTAPGKGPYSTNGKSGGLMYHTWRTPKMPATELGGVRSTKVPLSGTSRMETRVIKAHEVAQSGRAHVVGGHSRKGTPLALARIRATHVFWFDKELPTIRYQFEALDAGHPDDTRYTWQFAGKGTVQGKKVSWLASGFREHQVQLTAESAKGRSRSVVPYYGYATAKTSLENPSHRIEYRDTFITMLKNTPTQPDGAGAWPPSFWNNLMRTLDWGESFDLLAPLLAQRSSLVKQRLGQDRLAELQDQLLELAPRHDLKNTLKWLEQFRRTATGPRLNQLLIREGEIRLFYLSQVDQAGALFQRVSKFQTEEGTRAILRLGDLAFITGDLNRATGAYAKVQNDVRLSRNKAKTGQGEQWKLNALLEVSASENVAQLIDGGYFEQAKTALNQWERSFPLAKINSDFLIQEARLYQRVGDWQRSRVMLEAYCDTVDASSFLPDATLLVLEAMRKTNTPKADMKAYAEELLERLEFHPVADKIRRIVEENK